MYKNGFVPPKFATPRTSNAPRPAPVNALVDTKGKGVDRAQAQEKPKCAPVAGLYWTANWWVNLTLHVSSIKIYLSHCRRRPQVRKHKNWEGSGAISLAEGLMRLVNEEGHTCVTPVLLLLPDVDFTPYPVSVPKSGKVILRSSGMLLSLADMRCVLCQKLPQDLPYLKTCLGRDRCTFIQCRVCCCV